MMLVLTRRPDESLTLSLPGTAEQIIVTVLGVEGDKVKLGIAAPKVVKVLRQELCEAVREQNLAAARRAGAPAPVTPAALRLLLGDQRSSTDKVDGPGGPVGG